VFFKFWQNFSSEIRIRIKNTASELTKILQYGNENNCKTQKPGSKFTKLLKQIRKIFELFYDYYSSYHQKGLEA